MAAAVAELWRVPIANCLAAIADPLSSGEIPLTRAGISQVARIQSDLLEIDVAPSYGMTITSLSIAVDRRNVLWRRPGHRPKEASRRIGAAGQASIESLHESLIGGWFEMSPHAGIPGMLDGRETMLHGEASRLPWRVTRSETHVVEAVVECVRYPLELRRRLSLDGASLSLRSTITNIGSSPCSISHGEHPFYGRELFAGGTIDLEARSAEVLPPFDREVAMLRPGRIDWPHARTRDGKVVDLSGIPTHAEGCQDHVALELVKPSISITARDGLRVTTEVDLETHPYALLWRNHRARSEPSHGEWDVFALEPQTTPGASVHDAVAADALSRVEPHQHLTYTCVVTVASS